MIDQSSDSSIQGGTNRATSFWVAKITIPFCFFRAIINLKVSVQFKTGNNFPVANQNSLLVLLEFRRQKGQGNAQISIGFGSHMNKIFRITSKLSQLMQSRPNFLFTSTVWRYWRRFLLLRYNNCYLDSPQDQTTTRKIKVCSTSSGLGTMKRRWRSQILLGKTDSN